MKEDCVCHGQGKFYPVLDFNFLLNGESVKFYRKKKCNKVRWESKNQKQKQLPKPKKPKNQTKQKFQNQTKPNSSGKLLVWDKE